MDIKFYVWARPPGDTVSDPEVPIDPLWYNPMFVPLVKVWLRNVNQINSRPPDSERFATGPTDTIDRVVIRLQEWWVYLFGNPELDPPLMPKSHIYPNENRPVALFFQNFGRYFTPPTEVPALMQNDDDSVGVEGKTPGASRRGNIYSSAGRSDTGTYIDDLLDEWETNGPQDMLIDTLLWDLEQGINLFWPFNETADGDGNPRGWVYWALGDGARYPSQPVLDDVNVRAGESRTLEYIWEQEAGPRFGVNTKQFDNFAASDAPINQPIVRFVFTLWSRTLDWGLNETLYSKFKDWEFTSNPGVKPWADLTAGNYNVVTAHETEPADSLGMDSK